MSKKRKAIVCDLDGTLCDIAHRKHLIEKAPKEWDLFHTRMVYDTPNHNVGVVVATHIALGYVPIFVTGRFEKYRELTGQWLAKHYEEFLGVPLFMRADGDFRKDDVVKREIYQEKIEPHYSVRLVLDDRNHVVDMWRDLGLECWQVANGAY